MPAARQASIFPGVSPTSKAKKTARLTQVAPRDGHPVIKYKLAMVLLDRLNTELTFNH
jgi:hypothetical protein